MANYVPNDNLLYPIPINEKNCLEQVFHKEILGGEIFQCQNKKKYGDYCGKHRKDIDSPRNRKEWDKEHCQNKKHDNPIWVEMRPHDWQLCCKDCGKKVVLIK